LSSTSRNDAASSAQPRSDSLLSENRKSNTRSKLSRMNCGSWLFILLPNAKAHAPRSAGAGFGRGVGVMAWGGHENWAADRGCHAATCSWKEIPRKHGYIHGRSSPNPPPAQVTKPVPRRIGRTQAHKLLLRGCGVQHRKSCHLHRRLISTRHHGVGAGFVMSPPETHQARTALAHFRYAIALKFATNRFYS